MSQTEIEIFEEDGQKILELSDNDHVTSLYFFPEKKEFKQALRLTEDAYYRNEVYEYKINSNPIEVFIRLKERSDEPPLRWAVKDGVVLESEMEKEHKAPFLSLRKNFIDDLKNSVKWNQIHLPGGYAQIFYILSLHPEIISKDEYRKFLRQTEQRLKTGLSLIEERLKEKDKTGLRIIEGEYGKCLWYSDDEKISKKEKTDYVKKNFYVPLFKEDSPEFCGVSEYEFQQSPFILKHIEFLLNQKETFTKDKQPSKTKGFILSMLLTLFISWVVSWFVDINPFLIFILVNIVAFLQSILGGWLGKFFE